MMRGLFFAPHGPAETLACICARIIVDNHSISIPSARVANYPGALTVLLPSYSVAAVAAATPPSQDFAANGAAHHVSTIGSRRPTPAEPHQTPCR